MKNGECREQQIEISLSFQTSQILYDSKIRQTEKKKVKNWMSTAD